MAFASILKSVGEGGTNSAVDVMVVQALLKQIPDWRGGPSKPPLVTGLCGYDTKTAIGLFQDHWFEWSDGRVDPGGVTLAFLNAKACPLHARLPFLPTQPRYITQGTQNRCWAAVGAMMFNWQYGTNHTMPQFVAERCNSAFKTTFEADAELVVTRQPEYVRNTLKMKGKKAADYVGIGVEGWLDTLTAFKVMVVQHKVTSGGSWGFHARILCGMSGLGNPENTTMRVIDPWIDPASVPPKLPTYRSDLIPFEQFEREFDAWTGTPDVLRVWHY